MIEKTEAHAKVDLLTLSALSTDDISPPQLVIIRPSVVDTPLDLLTALRERWRHAHILGLFCRDWQMQCDMLQRYVAWMDDFISCPFEEIDFLPRIRRLLDLHKLERASADSALWETLHQIDLVGESEIFLEAVRKIPLVASSDATLTITGETGTGKELFAREVHNQSARQDKPFVAVNCGAIPEHLFENELFGHAKGAYTDASSSENGVLAEVDQGTLFLDEVDALTLSNQVKFLRFVQNREYRPLGCPQSRQANVRIIVATNADLAQRRKDNLFREDLFHRLNVLRLQIPPLRERSRDIPALVAHFLSKYGKPSYRAAGRISWSAMQTLLEYSWPGNVRELESVIQRALVLSNSGMIQPRHFELPDSRSGSPVPQKSFHLVKTQALGELERAYLANLLATHEGNLSKAATAAEMDRRTIQRLVRKHQLDLAQFRNAESKRAS
jgi:DNA-binding NtrC family response regulator